MTTRAPAGATSWPPAGAAGHTPLDRPVGELMGPVVVVKAGDAIADVAAAMTRAGASAAVVLGDRPGAVGASRGTDRVPAGIVTDADVRSRHVAWSGASGRPVVEIATTTVTVVSPEHSLAEALSLMASSRIHHLPVVDGTSAVGMITAGQLLACVAGDPLQVLASASTAPSVAELAAAYRHLPAVAGQLLGTGTGGLAVVRLLSLFGEQALARVVSWVGNELGPPPAPYAVVALGSLARREQTLVTDQDHALVVADGAGHEPWFAAFGEQVTDHLATVGFRRCPGEVMISNPTWRDEESAWRRRWEAFLVGPTPEHVLASNIVLDARPVSGDAALASPFLTAARRARSAGPFLLWLANSARDHSPPIGLFRRWQLERRGPHAGAFDVKAGIIVPIVQLARVHSLAAGSESMETLQRLRDAAGDRQISADSADILANGYELATTIRLADQVSRAEAGRELDNWVRPADLPAWQRAGLKEVAQTIRVVQDAIALSYQGAYVR